MTRPCKICSSEVRDRVDAALIAGDTVVSIAEAFGPATMASVSAFYRHARHPSSPLLRYRDEQDVPSVGDVAVGVARARARLADIVAQGTDAQVTRASRELAMVSKAYLEITGRDDDAAAAELAEYDVLGGGLRRTIRDHPEVGDWLAAAFRQLGEDESWAVGAEGLRDRAIEYQNTKKEN